MFSDCISYSPLCLSLFNRLLALILVSLCAVAPIRAQCSFNSGSTGANGAFNPTTSQTVQLPESGVFNFTNVNIPLGVTIKFARNAKNTPVTILASGNITIVGTIDISGSPGSLSSFGAAAPNGAGVGGPGGFDGGRGGFSFAPFFSGTAGDGPGGGGSAISFSGGGGSFGSRGRPFDTGDGGSGGKGGQKYGTRTLVPLIGGSGGGGSGGHSGLNGFGGGGGGGAILLASSGTIHFGDAQGGGSILANGGLGGVISNLASGNGAGGAIKLVANTITGRATLQVQSVSMPGQGYQGGHGYIRLEACNYNGFQPTASPATTSTDEPMISLAAPKPVALPNAPTLKITSVAGIAAPAMPAGSFHRTPDIIIPAAQTNPVAVALQASNVPLGTVVSVTVAPEFGPIVTVQSAPLAGTIANSNTTVNVDLPPSGASLISAQLSFTPTSISSNRSLLPPLLIDGERIQRVEVSARFGGQSEVTYITESGRRIKRSGE